MCYLRHVPLVCLLVTAVHILPQVSLAETLTGAMAKAYQNNPDLNAARAALRAVDENVIIAKAAMRPHVTGIVEAEASRTNLDKAASKIVDNKLVNVRRTDALTSSYGITISQQIFDGFQTLYRVRAAEANVLANRESLRAQEISILLAAAEAYANIARDQTIVSIRRQNISFLQEQVSAAKARLKVGEGTRTDVNLAEAELASARALLTVAVSSLKQSEAAYVQIVGETPKEIKQPSPAKNAMPSSLDSAVAVSMRENPNVLAAMRGADAAGYNVKEAEGVMLPGVSLQGSVYKSVNSEEGGRDNLRGAISARLTVPIYQGGAEYGQIRQAKERLGESQLVVDSARMEVQRTVISAHAQYDAASASAAAIGVQINAANEALNGVIEERNVGQRTTLDVLNAQQNVLDAKEDLAAVQRNAVVASYSLLAAMGALTVRNQGLQVAEYRAELHYEAVKDRWFGLRTVDDGTLN